MYTTSTHSIPEALTDDDAGMNIEQANIALSTTASAFAEHKKGPTLHEIGTPGNLANYLPDSSATQHMTPHQADLFNEVDGKNLGVKVADGHVIKFSITGKTQLDMLDDNGNPLNAVLQDVMYIPGLSRRLFSRDILRMPDGHVKHEWLKSVRKELKLMVDSKYSSRIH